MLIELLIKGRDLPLAKRVVEGVVNGQGGKAQPRGRIAIDLDGGLETARLLIAAHVPQLGQPAQLLHQQR